MGLKMEQGTKANEYEWKTDTGFYIRTCGFALLCGCIVVSLRSGFLQSWSLITVEGTVYSVSDFFVILAAGICGYRYGLFAFGVVFLNECLGLFDGNQTPATLSALSIYLLITLLTGYFSNRRWFQSLWRTFLAGVALVLVLGSCWHLMRSIMLRGGFSSYDDMSVWELYLGAVPEVYLALAFIYLFFRLVPDGKKKRIGYGYLYTEEFERLIANSPTRGHSVLGTTMTLLAIAEAVLLSLFSILLYDLNRLFIERRMDFSRQWMVTDLRMLFLMLCVSIPVAIILNEVVLRIVVWPMNRMAAVMDNYFSEEEEARKRSVRELEHLGFSSKNELGRLYHALCQMVEAMSDYIANIKREQKLEEELRIAEESGKAQAAFFSSVSHELRTPINAVLGMDEMILRESREDAILEYAGNIQNAGSTLLGLINDILDFSKIEAGKMDIVPADYEFASMLNDLVNMIKERAKKKGLELYINSDSQMPSVLNGDEVRIKQVATNILTNAVKYTEKGSVTLDASFQKLDESSISLTIHVKDTGIGIKKEDQAKLFSAFERIEEKRNRNIEGTGLGMNITKSLLEMMGGSLEVESVYGEGSDFSFTVAQRVVSWEPVGDFQETLRRLRKNREAYRESFRAPEARILAVDDTELNLSVFCGLLKQTRVQIDTAQSGFECLEKMEKERYDIIFLDHRMPEMDGIETMHRMETLENNQCQGVPVIALTANATSDARAEYLKAGFRDYLSKPIDAKKLEDMVRTYLPKEKVVLDFEPEEGGSGMAAPKEAGQPQSAELPVVDGLDWEVARLHLPDMDLLENTVKDFYQSIDQRAAKLDEDKEGLPGGEAWDSYRIHVHSMKSLAATVGMLTSAGLARVLEAAATKQDLETVLRLHGLFLQEWRANKERLQGVFGLGQDEPRLEYEPEVVRGLLQIVGESMAQMDVDKADGAMQMLGRYRYPKDVGEEIGKLAAAVMELDDDEALRIVEGLQGLTAKNIPR